MNKTLSRHLTVILSVLLIAAQFSFLQPLATFAANLESAVTIMALDETGEKVLDAQAVQIEEGDTAWDVLEKAGAELDYDEYSFGNLLKGINGVAPDYDQDGKFWAFIVNGSFAQEGASSYKVNHGDHITFIVTNETNSPNIVTVSAVADDEEILQETEIDLPTYATAYDAIIKAAKSNDLALKVNIHSQFLSFIDNIADYEKADNQWWEIQVNGEALQVGGLSHQIQPGEHIQLVLKTYQDPETEEDPTENVENGDDNPTDKEVPKKNGKPSKQDPQTDNDSKTETPSFTYLQQAKNEINILADYVLANQLATKYGDEWWVWAMTEAGYTVPIAYIDHVEAEILKNKGNFSSVFDLEKVIIALSAAGINAEDVAGNNLLEKLAAHKDLENPMINAAIYALIAMNSGNYTIDKDEEERILSFILNSELEKGGWSFFGSEPDIDITAMALIAFANYQDNPEVKGATDRALAFLAREQHENGGYYDEWNGGYSSESAAQVIVALSLLNIDPTGNTFTKDGKNLLDYLLGFKVPADNLYGHVLGDKESNLMATQQALLAWAHYLKYLERNAGGGEPAPIPTPSPKPNLKSEGYNNIKTIPPAKVGEQQNNLSDKHGEKLPNTKTDLFHYIVFGSFILAMGAILLFIQRKYKIEE